MNGCVNFILAQPFIVYSYFLPRISEQANDIYEYQDFGAPLWKEKLSAWLTEEFGNCPLYQCLNHKENLRINKTNKINKTMRNIAFLLLLLLTLPLHAAEEDMTLTTPTGNIYGKLLLPQGEQPCPVVLLIAGSGPTDMNGNTIGSDYNNNSLLYLAQELAKEGIATLRYDKRGIGKSTGAGASEEELRFEHYIDDAVLWCELLAGDKRFTHITIAGHSEGSLIGMVASNKSDKVSSYISIAGSGTPAYTLIEEQLGKQSPALQAEAERINNCLRRGETMDDVPPYLKAIYRKSVQPYLISWFQYDPAKEITKLKIPVLILQGDKDIQVSTRESQKLFMARMFSSYYIIENMNHVLKHCESENMLTQLETYKSPSFPVKPELIERITRFIKQ